MRWTKFCKKTARRVSLRRTLSVISLCALLCGSALSQQTTLRSESNVVLIPALVKDAQGKIVYGLRAEDFIVEDEGVVQPFHLDETLEGQPVSLVAAIQRGRRAYHEFPRMQGLKTMLEPLFSAGTARVAVVEFDSHVDLIRNFTGDASLVAADLQNLQPGDGGGAILDAIGYSINLLKDEPEERERVLLLISEMRDHGSKEKIDDTVAAIGQTNTVIDALAFSPSLSNILDTGRGTNLDEMHEGINFIDLMYRTAQAMRKNIPGTITSLTGGEYELFTTRKNFEVRMNDFTNHLHSRYLLSFAPRNPHPGLHQIRVRPKNSHAGTVLARTRYWVEAAKE